MTARWITADVFDGLATLETGSVDLVVTSPPFLALRSYLPADHPDKSKEIGSEATPAEFIDTLLRVTAELRRVLAPHGSICIELGDTYAGSSMDGGDQKNLRDGMTHRIDEWASPIQKRGESIPGPRVKEGWPLAKSRTLIPSLYQIALAYGINPLTGQASPAGQWRIRNIVTWARPNPPVGALGDKWRPATSDLVVACTSGKQYWDDLATRREAIPQTPRFTNGPKSKNGDHSEVLVGFDVRTDSNPSGAPLLDYWVIPPGGYTGAHYAVFPEELVVPCIQAMCPPKVCRECGEPSRRIVEWGYEDDPNRPGPRGGVGAGREDLTGQNHRGINDPANRQMVKVPRSIAVSDCGHNAWRPGRVLDPFAGSGTTLVVATGHGHDAIGIDIDERNAELARDRVGPFLFEMVDLPVPTP